MGRQLREDREDGSRRKIDGALSVYPASEAAVGAVLGNREEIAAQLDNESLLVRLACWNVRGFALRKLESVFLHGSRSRPFRRLRLIGKR
jgi:hypothetical protein